MIDAVHRYEQWLAEYPSLKGCVYYKCSINDEKVRHVLLQSSHYFAFDARFSDETMIGLAETLQNMKHWKVLVSTRRMKQWNQWGLTGIRQLQFQKGYDNRVSLAVSGGSFRWYCYAMEKDMDVA